MELMISLKMNLNGNDLEVLFDKHVHLISYVNIIHEAPRYHLYSNSLARMNLAKSTAEMPFVHLLSQSLMTAMACCVVRHLVS